MFTGLVDHCGAIQSIEMLPERTVVYIETQFLDLQPGESIAVDGVCVTVVEAKLNGFLCELSSETLARTSARFYKIGDRVNLERALRLMDRMGGHFVTGHVDQTIILTSKEEETKFARMVFNGISEESQLYMIKKGSVAINGVSLTINHVMKDVFFVMLIPHTLEKTNLKDLVIGREVNVEFDLIAKITVQTTREIISNEQSV
ncbi:riboflavin synthase [Candidatus Coxiella mudrowiae]|uniref:riboflavin synthase n=1 Tax=Candidatus Coxiella mudrowiae TaxID=2054173 RepID=UPI000C2952D1|nr:riboflavin synthase [Candidatus Coxiella mudrowiae]